MIRLALAAALALAAGAALAHPAMTADPTIMRAAPSAHARPVQNIPAHAQIDVGECGERWCAASWRNIDGFVRVEAIAPNDAPLVGAPPPPYYGGPVVVGPVFGFGYYHRW
jgi:SH3-like domain-containing protein